MLAGDPFTEPLYFCVEVPPGQPSVTFTLSGLTGDLDLFVGFDTFQELSGGVGLRFSDNQGVEDEAIIVEPSVYRGELLGFDQYADVTPGPYWIEVSGDPSTFALSVVRTP